MSSTSRHDLTSPKHTGTSYNRRSSSYPEFLHSHSRSRLSPILEQPAVSRRQHRQTKPRPAASILGSALHMPKRQTARHNQRHSHRLLIRHPDSSLDRTYDHDFYPSQEQASLANEKPTTPNISEPPEANPFSKSKEASMAQLPDVPSGRLVPSQSQQSLGAGYAVDSMSAHLLQCFEPIRIFTVPGIPNDHTNMEAYSGGAAGLLDLYNYGKSEYQGNVSRHASEIYAQHAAGYDGVRNIQSTVSHDQHLVCTDPSDSIARVGFDIDVHIAWGGRVESFPQLQTNSAMTREIQPEEETERKFACPYFKHDKHKDLESRVCFGTGWLSVHRVKFVFPLDISCARC